MESVNRNQASRQLVISLARMRSRAARRPWLSRGLTAAMALSLALVLTPCCEIFGDAFAASGLENSQSRHVPAADNGLHTHGTDGHGDICGKWLDDASSPVAVSYGPLASSWEGKATLRLSLVSYPQMFRQADAAMWRPLHSVSPPSRPLFLKFARLLL